MRRTPLLAFTLLLAACNSDGSIGRPGSPAWFDTASNDTQLAYFSQRCAGYGFATGSPEMAQCMQNEYISARQIADSRSARSSAGLAAAGAIVSRPQPSFPTMQAPVRCFSQRDSFGGVHTVCR